MKKTIFTIAAVAVLSAGAGVWAQNNVGGSYSGGTSAGSYTGNPAMPANPSGGTNPDNSRPGNWDGNTQWGTNSDVNSTNSSM